MLAPIAGKSKKILMVATIVILALAGVAYWYMRRVVKPTAEVAVPGTANQPTQDLGSTLYNKASNPVSGVLPNTVAPVTNPVKGLYKNPF